MATTFEYDGKEYELTMTRAGLRAAEAAGLETSKLADKPQTAIGLLFFAALFSQYKVSPGKAVTMLDELLDSGALEFEPLFEELAEEYSELFG